MYLSVQTEINDSKNIGLQVHQIKMHQRKYRRQFRLQKNSKRDSLIFLKKKSIKFYYFYYILVLLMTVKFAKFTSDLLAR